MVLRHADLSLHCSEERLTDICRLARCIGIVHDSFVAAIIVSSAGACARKRRCHNKMLLSIRSAPQ